MNLWDEVAKAKARLKSEAAARHSERKKETEGVSDDEKQPPSESSPVPPDDEISLGTVSAPSAATVAERCIDRLEWLFGLEQMTEEQEKYAARIRKKYAAMISIRNRKPYLDSLGIPRFPPDCEPEYRHWEGGQPLLETLLELGASDRVIDMRVTEKYSPGDWYQWLEIKEKRRK